MRDEEWVGYKAVKHKTYSVPKLFYHPVSKQNYLRKSSMESNFLQRGSCTINQKEWCFTILTFAMVELAHDKVEALKVLLSVS